MEKECVFCNIVAGKIPATFLYQDDKVIALRDIQPLAPTHILVMPKEHIPSLTELRDEHRDAIARLVYVASELARSDGIAESGYRLSMNCGPDAGQAVPHVHLHLIGGRKLSENI